ncbi:MAG: hypothetical protein ACRDQX_14800 [Pseudonocardiaceae bacterium]
MTDHHAQGDREKPVQDMSDAELLEAAREEIADPRLRGKIYDMIARESAGGGDDSPGNHGSR